MDAPTLGVILSGAVSVASIGAVYGILKATLTTFISNQIETNKALWKKVESLDSRMNVHLENHNCRVQK